MLTFTDGAIVAGGNILSSASHSCVSADVGQQIILHGSGASGFPRRGIVPACSGATFVLSFGATLPAPWNGVRSAIVAIPQSGSGSNAPNDTLTCVGGTGGVFAVSATPAQSASVAAGSAACVNSASQCDSRRRWLAAGSRDGAGVFPGGTIIAVGNTTSAFCDMSSATIRDPAIYYPLQDGAQPTPIACPRRLKAHSTSTIRFVTTVS
jgi:hypothetical protein